MDKFAVYRCPDPVAVITDKPWYSYSNVCPCDPKLSNQSGRGFTACPLGIMENNDSTESSWLSQQFNSQKKNQVPIPSRIVGNMYNDSQFVPPQLQPRQLVRVGQVWRDKN